MYFITKIMGKELRTKPSETKFYSVTSTGCLIGSNSRH